MLPQPPPDAPAPPPSEAALLSRRKWKRLWVTGVFSILILGLVVFIQMSIRVYTRYPLTDAVINARQIGFALSDFKDEYGAYPDAGTAVAVQKATGTTLNLGTKTSNDFFRQLIGANFILSEKLFSAKIKGARRPDDNITGAEALKKGECGFTYFLGAKITGDNPSRPIVATPMIPGTDRFDPKPFDGKAVILRLDCSVTSLLIDKAGHVIVDGRNLMDPSNPIWDGHAPVIAWPE